MHGFRQILPQLDMQAIQDYAYEAPKSGKIMEILQTEVLWMANLEERISASRSL